MDPKVFVRFIRDLAFAVFLALFIIVFLYRPVRVEGTSMMPGLTDDERIFISQMRYRFHVGEIRRGDTVVFWYPLDQSKSYIKRVIGLPGDAVEIRRGAVLVNHRALDEPYVPDDYRERSSMDRVVVPKGEYFVLGDHRNSSSDSRAWGMLDQKLIYGKAVFVYWPITKMGRL